MSYNSKYTGAEVDAALGLANTALQEHQDISGKQDKVDVISHGISDVDFALVPNEYHVWGEVASLTLTLAEPSDTTVYNEYMFEFVSGETATSLSLPATVSWVSEPLVEVGKTYQCSIVNNIGIILSV